MPWMRTLDWSLNCDFHCWILREKTPNHSTPKTCMLYLGVVSQVCVHACMCVCVEVWPPSFCTLGHWASGTLVNSHVDAVGSHLSVESPSASRDLGWQRKWCPDLHGQDSWLVLHRSGQVHIPHLPVVCSSSLL